MLWYASRDFFPSPRIMDIQYVKSKRVLEIIVRIAGRCRGIGLNG